MRRIIINHADAADSAEIVLAGISSNDEEAVLIISVICNS